MSIWLPAFESVEECERCGAFTDGYTQQAGMKYMWNKDEEEWIQRSCWRCGFNWNERVKDGN